MFEAYLALKFQVQLRVHFMNVTANRIICILIVYLRSRNIFRQLRSLETLGNQSGIQLT